MDSADPNQPGIFGAMNQGFFSSQSLGLVVVLGSDDWAAGPCVLSEDPLNSRSLGVS